MDITKNKALLTPNDLFIRRASKAGTANSKDFLEYNKHDKLTKIDCVDFFDIYYHDAQKIKLEMPVGKGLQVPGPLYVP